MFNSAGTSKLASGHNFEYNYLTPGTTYYLAVYPNSNWNPATSAHHDYTLNVVNSATSTFGEPVINDGAGPKLGKGNKVSVNVSGGSMAGLRLRLRMGWDNNGATVEKGKEVLGSNVTFNDIEISGGGTKLNVAFDIVNSSNNTVQSSTVTQHNITGVMPATLEFTKATNSNYIYVNNPEYITRYDMTDKLSTDDYSTWFGKIFEQTGIKGTNTYYQTHLAWWGYEEERNNYDPHGSFYMDVDFYNPTNHDITVYISKLAYGTNPNDLKSYMEGWGESKTAVIPAGKHWRMFTHVQPSEFANTNTLPNGFDQNWQLRHPSTDGDWTRKIFIMFDFDVSGVSGSEGVMVSSLAAYNKANLVMSDNFPRLLHDGVTDLRTGEMREAHHRDIEINSEGKNELPGKYKGIALSQSNRVDARLDFIIDNSILQGNRLNVTLRENDPSTFTATGPPRDKWMNNINPINDSYYVRYYAPPSNLHTYEYTHSDGRMWLFGAKYRNTLFKNNSGSIISQEADGAMSSLQTAFMNPSAPSTGTPINADAIGMGAWGTTYRYTLTITNSSYRTRIVRLYALGPANTLYGLKQGYSYSVKDAIGAAKPTPVDLDAWYIDPGETRVIDFITLSALGDGGQEYYLEMAN